MPCWNEEGKVGPGVKAVPKDLVDTVCVVDNGSIDNTRRESLDAGALVISHSVNLGARWGYKNRFRVWLEEMVRFLSSSCR